MFKNILNLPGVAQLSKKEQEFVNGGAGPYSLRCNNGSWIDNCPDNSSGTGATACGNNGGYSGSWFCFGCPAPLA